MAPPAEPLYTIPDLLISWPWISAKNPDLAAVQKDANAWVESLNLFKPEQLQKFKACEFNLLAALVGPILGEDYLRISCDLMNFYFAFDEYTDVVNKEDAMKICHNVMETMRTRIAVKEDIKITEMARQFFERTISVVGDDKPGLHQFILDFEAYATSMIQEADDRAEDRIRGVEEYLVLRRDTCGAKPSFSFLALGLNLPKEVFEHPLMIALTERAADLVAMTNDMHSYSLERARGLDGHNILTCIMHEHSLDLQKALYWLDEYAKKTIAKFQADRVNLHSFGSAEVDVAVLEYIDRMARCVRGYDFWSYETVRYYGNQGLEVQKSRKITLMPKQKGYITREELVQPLNLLQGPTMTNASGNRIVKIGTPRRDPTTGTPRSQGANLSQPGVTEWCFDILYVMWACQIGSGVFGDRFWWLCMIIPLHGIFKLWSPVNPPLLMGGGQSSGLTAGAADKAAAPRKREE